MGLMAVVRNRFHPLHRLRKNRWFARWERRFDVPVKTRVEGLSKPLYGRLFSHAFLRAGTSGYEELVTQTILEVFASLPERAVFWDVGSNIGLYTARFKQARPEGVCHCFEPDPSNLVLLRRNAEVWGVAPEAVHDTALSDTDGTATFNLDGMTGCTSSLATSGESFVAEHYGAKPIGLEVVTKKVDTVVAEGVPAPDLVKLDTEGAEDMVFAGADRLLREKRPVWVYESNHKGLLCRSILEPYGYKVLNADTGSAEPAEAGNFLAFVPELHLPLFGEALDRLGYQLDA